jgi:phosphopantothenoylcysteine decarboxylase / phosphopantothenate---cysteine ligase
VRVESSEEMFNATVKNYSSMDIVICSAAVADYKPSRKNEQKIKKKDAALQLDLVPTMDILAHLGKEKTSQYLVGFALETENLLENATKKLQKKNLDLIVANSAGGDESGIGGENNRITLIDKHNKISKFELKSKREAARDIVNYIITNYHK